MQEKQEAVENNVEETKVEETGATDTQPVVEEKVEGVETIEQKAQKMADAMVAKKMKGMPTKEELKSFKEWQDSQKSEEQKKQEDILERQKLETEIESLKREKEVLKKGIKEEDIDYVLFKLSKLDGDFEDNLNTFLKENPKFMSSAEQGSISTGIPTQRKAINENLGFETILKERNPDLKI